MQIVNAVRRSGKNELGTASGGPAGIGHGLEPGPSRKPWRQKQSAWPVPSPL